MCNETEAEAESVRFSFVDYFLGDDVNADASEKTHDEQAPVDEQTEILERESSEINDDDDEIVSDEIASNAGEQ